MAVSGPQVSSLLHGAFSVLYLQHEDVKSRIDWHYLQMTSTEGEHMLPRANVGRERHIDGKYRKAS